MNIKWKAILVVNIAIAMVAVGYLVFGRNVGQMISIPGLEEFHTRFRVPVEVMPVSVQEFEEWLDVQGNLNAKHSAVVSANVTGTIEEIFVEPGQMVK